MTNTLDARSREVEAELRGIKRVSKVITGKSRNYKAADLIAEQRAEIERLNAAMVLVPRMTGKQD